MLVSERLEDLGFFYRKSVRIKVVFIHSFRMVRGIFPLNLSIIRVLNGNNNCKKMYSGLEIAYKKS